jgi:hypothetical protein
MEMACDAAPSRRETFTLTWDDATVPGQSILNPNRVETTKDPGFFWLVSPYAEAPLK